VELILFEGAYARRHLHQRMDATEKNVTAVTGSPVVDQSATCSRSASAVGTTSVAGCVSHPPATPAAAGVLRLAAAHRQPVRNDAEI
jgi:hypothetical protein